MKKILKYIIYKINNANPFLICIITSLYLFVVILLLIHSFLNNGDIAEYLNNPLRIVNGDLPYRDFWLLYTPGEVYFPALIYKLLGVNVNYILLITTIVSQIIPCFVFFFAKQFLKINFISAIATIVFYFTGIIYLCGPQYIHLYFAFLIFSAIFLLKYFRNPKNYYVFLSGIFLGIAFFFRFYEVGAVACAFTITLIIYFILNKFSIANAIKSFSIYAIGALIVIAIFSLSFYSIFSVMCREVIIESVKNGTSMKLPFMFNLIYTFKIFSNSFNDFFLIHSNSQNSKILFVSMFFQLFSYPVFYLLPFLSIILFILYVTTKPDKNDLIIVILLFLWGELLLPKAFSRFDLAHLSLSTTPFLLLSFFFVKQFYEIRTRTAKRNIIYFTSLICIILLSNQVIASNINILFSLKNSISTVYTKHGTVTFDNLNDANNFNSVVNYIEQNSNNSDYIFVTWWDAPSLYALTNRRNPTYYDSMNDLIIRPSITKQKKLCEDLITKNTKIIVHYADWGYDDKPEQTFRYACPIIQNFITTHYKLVACYGHYHIYVP